MEPTRSSDLLEIDLSGRQIGGYRLLRRLGQGAMAEVYLAEQTSLRRQVAVKVLKRELAKDETYVRRFHLEAQAAASLVHANIVQIHEVGCEDGVHFIVQEYVQGLNLGELLKRHGPPQLKQAVAIMRQTVAALRKAAEQGIVHRDIKPENIMVAQSGEVKVADFGLARLTGSDTALTQIGFTMGTPLYMSPEQVEGRSLDPRSDIYSFGVTSYHILAGEPPFRGETTLAVAVAHLKEQPPRLDNARPDLPPALCRIVHKMLAKNPADRYPSPVELQSDLRALVIEGLSHEEGAEDLKGLASDEALTSTGRQANTERLAAIMRTSVMEKPRRRRWLGLVVIVLLFLLLGLGVAWMRRERPLLTGAAKAESNVEPRETAEAQFIYALMADTEDGWLSVERYFPKDQVYGRRARQQLARWYLDQGDNATALTLFTQFAEMPDLEDNFRAFGVAGQALALAGQGRNKEAGEKIAALTQPPLRGKLDGQMEERVANLLQRHGEALGVSQDNWRQLFNRPTTDAGGDESSKDAPPKEAPSKDAPGNDGTK